MLAPERFVALLQLYADAAAALDAQAWDRWVDCFTDDCRYLLQPRENHERGLPLATMRFESKGMLRDRAHAVGNTLFHDPYYQRHLVGIPRVLKAETERIEAEANYAVFRTKPDEPSSVFNVGRSLDVVRVEPDGRLRFAERTLVFDSELIPNSIIYPL
jgi:salicylate 5-hydroxylase small subunit